MKYELLAKQIKIWALELGFQKLGISDIDLQQHEIYLQNWLSHHYHGEMDWMERHGLMRARPNELHPNTLRVLSVRMDYLPPQARFAVNLSDPTLGYISRYALGRDYHKLIRNQLKKLALKIEEELPQLNYRPFVDSAPILERPLAEKAGLGWVGKHSLLLDKEAGSWFFLGELLVDIPLPIDTPVTNECGKCRSCVTSCPTGAIVDDKIVDARKCNCYLTIEFNGVIPEPLRKQIGNRIYGCDDCQLVCPWNRFASLTSQPDFHRRPHLEEMDLLTLFNWSEEVFLAKTEGSAIRRIGHQQWLRNIAIAIGNAPYSSCAIDHLKAKLGISELLDIHLQWAIEQQEQAKQNGDSTLTSHKLTSNKQQRLIRIIDKGLVRDA